VVARTDRGGVDVATGSAAGADGPISSAAPWRRTCGTPASLGPATEGEHGAGARVRPASARPSDGEPASLGPATEGKHGAGARVRPASARCSEPARQRQSWGLAAASEAEALQEKRIV
jgi:hypothetical protein